MLDLNVLVNNSFKKIEEEGFVQEVVEKKIKGTIEDIVDDCFRSYSTFGKNLKKEVEENLKINLEELNLSTYNTLVLGAVKEKLDEVIHMQGIEKIKTEMDDILKCIKGEYKLSELIELLKKDVRRSYYSEEVEGSEISLHVDKDRTLIFIYFDGEEDKSSYECKYRLVIDPKTNKLDSVEIKGTKLKDNAIMGGLYGLDKELFKIYASGAKIIVDDEDIDKEFGYDD